MKTRRATHMWTRCCELETKTRSALSSLDCFQFWYLSLVLVKCKWTSAQSLDAGHFNEKEAVQFVENWDSILCPFDGGVFLKIFF